MMVDAASRPANDSASPNSAPAPPATPAPNQARPGLASRPPALDNTEELIASDSAPQPRPLSGTKAAEHPIEADEETESGPMANAPFVNKVWLIVNNPDNHPYIRWVPGGKSIIIVDREGFEKQLLPYYFKHKRFTSFVRQLNMYGWHKVQDLSAGTMQSSEEHWQFANPNFIQGQPELLKDIVRNKGHRPTNSANAQPPAAANATAPGQSLVANGGAEQGLNVQVILSELEQIKSRQQAIGDDLGRIRKDNELLWNEYYQTRERYDKHSQLLGRILRFLATIYGNQSKILDLNDPMGEIMMQNTPQPVPHHPLNLLPASQKSAFNSGIHDLQEIEQLQHEIEEASPGSVSNSNPAYSHRSSESSLGGEYTNGSLAELPPFSSHATPNSLSSISSIDSQPPLNAKSAPDSHISPYMVPPRSGTPLNAAGVGSNAGAHARALSNRAANALPTNYAPTSRVPHASPHPPSNALALANHRRLSTVPYWSDSSAVTNAPSSSSTVPSGNNPHPSSNNQLIRTTPSRFVPPDSSRRGASVPPQLSRTPGNAGAASSALTPVVSQLDGLDPTNLVQADIPGHVSPIESPDSEDQPRLIEPSAMDQDDPAALFPELNDLGTPDMPPLTSQELEQIGREVASNDSSLQNIQDWLFRQNGDNEEHFNVDDFLDDGGLTPPSTTDAKGRKNSSVLEEPEKKRVRAS